MTAAVLALSLLLTATMPTEVIEEACDTIAVRMYRRTGVKAEVKLSKALQRKEKTDLYFTKKFLEFPWRTEDEVWLRDTLDFILGQCGYSLGEVYAKNQNIHSLLTPHIGNDGTPTLWRISVEDPIKPFPFIEEQNSRRFTRGLDRRYIALWQSHGLFFDATESRWSWQRPPLHTTVEDMFTQSFVLPYLMPMLENAGAYVMSPRERDTQTFEAIIDNDISGSKTRDWGVYSETGRWKSVTDGFADTKEFYEGKDNPFRAGTYRTAECVAGKKATATAIWTLKCEGRRRCSVYIAYKSLPNSSSCAHYTVKHCGGTSHFIVNQRIGGGTWIRLGEFDLDSSSSISLDNSTPAGRSCQAKTVVCADAVKIGGGMGKILREGSPSGMPAYIEGAMYNMQWSGISYETWHGWDSEYTNDFASRGAWVKEMKERGIPFDLSIAFHTDAGTTPNDSTVGTLAIYTLRNEGKEKTSDGVPRISSRLLCDFIQSQIVEDVRFRHDPLWNRRGIWDKSYSECRTTDVPGMILELLSHQNFSDMRQGLDPSFKFTVSRAIYKGILKFLSSLYGVPYTVQPLPVRDFSVSFADTTVLGSKARLSWNAVQDPFEPTAKPSGYIVYTRIDDGSFDSGKEVKTRTVDLSIKPGHIYSYKVVAFNEGGKSFPSETLCIFAPTDSGSSTRGESIAGLSQAETGRRISLIINGFTSVRAPYAMNSPQYAGFDGREDSGVPYIEDISYIGQVYNFCREEKWVNNFEPGCGGCYTDYAPMKVAGNSFDFAYLHGQAFVRKGMAFCSSSESAFCEGRKGVTGPSAPRYSTIDLIRGKELADFSPALLDVLEDCAQAGTGIIISGSNIGSAENADSTGRTRRLLGYRWLSSHGSPDGQLETVGRNTLLIYNKPNPERYCVENPDAIRPVQKAACSIPLKYTGRHIPAAVYYDAGKYRVAAYGFPLETIKGGDEFLNELSAAIDFVK